MKRASSQRWYEEARDARRHDDRAASATPSAAAFFSTSDDHEELIARRKEIGDHPIPSGNSAAALGLLRLAALSGERAYEDQATGVLQLFAKDRAAPAQTPSPTCFVRSTSTSPRSKRSRWSATGSSALAAIVRWQPPPPSRPRRRPGGQPRRPSSCRSEPRSTAAATAYVCENFACKAPVTDSQELAGVI